MTVFYSSELSPFGARLRIVAALSGAILPDALPPPDGTASAAMKAINPFGQVPCLVVGDKTLIESQPLMEFVLETSSGGETLLPSDPVSRARVRGLIAAHDNHIVPALRPLFAQLMSAESSAAIIHDAFLAVDEKLEALLSLFDPDGFAVEGKLSIADIAIVVFASIIERIASRFGVANPFHEIPRAKDWWDTVHTVPEIALDTQRRNAAFAKVFGA